jgi:serine/threonine protein kinase
MTFCLNPQCPHPENLATVQICQGCGQPLEIMGRYRAMRLLGQGGAERTWLAEVLVERGKGKGERGNVDINVDSKARNHASITEQRVVIKQHWPVAADRASPERFWQAVERLRQVGAAHPQIPSLLEAGDGQWGQLLIQEYIQGPNLEQVLERDGPLTAGQVQALLQSLLPVLEYLQSFHVIHRDIKPENLRLPDPQGPWMLVDLSVFNTHLGSAAYGAPEQVLGQGSFASDLYSLGVTCIHALTGLPPFELYSVSEERWVWRDFLTQPLDASLGRVLDKLLARSPAERYQTAAQVSLALPQSAAKWDPLAVLRPPAKPPMPRLPRVTILPWHLAYRITQPLGISSALAIRPDGQGFATGSDEGSLYLWDLPTGTLIHAFKRRGGWGQGHRDRITALRFSPEGRSLYSASLDGTVKVWDLQTLGQKASISPPGGFPTALVLTPQWLVSASSSGQITLWDAHRLTPLQRLTQHQDRVSQVEVTADGQQLASASWDGTVRLWGLPEGKLRQAFPAHKGRVTALALHPLGNPVISGGQDGQVKVWQVGAHLTCDLLYRADDGITALALSADARLVAVGTEGNVLTVWQGTTGICVSRVPQGWGVVAIAFSPDSKTLISTGQDETISVWQR